MEERRRILEVWDSQALVETLMVGQPYTLKTLASWGLVETSTAVWQ
jgi:hypothetical protein